MQAYVVAAAAVLVVGVGLLANLLGDSNGEPPLPLQPSGAPVAAATATAPPSATPRATRRPTPAPTPTPTPRPTLAPMVAAMTTAELAPTGVTVADDGDPAINDLVADVNGTVWATRAGAVLNVDPRTGRTREWTLADDPAFANADLAPSRQGGVWLVGPEQIRLFDGERFRKVIETPGPMRSVVEGPDGSLWAQADRYELIRWADGAWASGPPGRPGHGASSIVVDADNRVWTVNFDEDFDEEYSETPRGISAWDGSAWTTFTREGLPDPVFGDTLPDLVVGGDGTVWMVRGRILVRIHAGESSRYDAADVQGSVSLSAVDDDGRLWFVREACDSCDVQIHVDDGSTVTTYGAEDGLPGASDVGWEGTTVLPGPGRVLAATGAGLYRLTDGSWIRLELPTRIGSGATGPSLRYSMVALAAISRAEVWATTQRFGGWDDGPQHGGLFRFGSGAWQEQRLPVESTVGQAVVAPDGVLWVATGSGPLVRRDGTWIDLGDTVAGVVPDPGEVDAYCGGTVFIGGDGVTYYAGPRSGNRVVALLPRGDSWEARLPMETLLPVDPPAGCGSTLAATADGTLWWLERGWGTKLSRSTGGGWEVVSLSPGDQPGVAAFPSAIVVDRDGSLWVAAQTWDQTTDSSR
ncbi:MAG: hypothetical protein MUQ32_10680, partial [Chloroflexi bacterium]|nr:hypothetical protein [Chloroflexota bacterium]